MSANTIIERERARATPAAVAAFIALALLIVSLFSRTQIPSSSNSSIQLAAFNAHPGALVFSSILSGLGFALFSIPLAFLFGAARDRNPRVQPMLIAICFIGPVLIGAQGVINGLGLKKAAADYVAMPKEQTQSLAQFTSDLDAKPPTVSKVNIYTDTNALEVERVNGSFYSVSYTQAQEKKLIGAADASSVSSTSEIGKSGIDNSIDSGGKVGDAQASKVADDNSTVKLATDLIFPAALAMIFAVIYTALQSYRVGLLTRFFGTLGMALGAALILLPQAPVFIALWLGWLGLIFINRVPGGRPPAWDAGEAIPWPPSGGQADKGRGRGGGRGGTVEGTGRESEPTNGDESTASAGAVNRRKRKRRR